MHDRAKSSRYAGKRRNLNDPSDPVFEPTDVPTHKAFVFADWEAAPWLHVIPSLDIASYRLTVSSAGTNYYRTASYINASLRVGYEINDLVAIGTGVRNAFDDLYYLTDGFGEGGRRLFLTARRRS